MTGPTQAVQETTIGAEEAVRKPLWRRIRWGRLLKRLAIGSVVVLILARVLLPFVLPSIVARVAKGQGLHVKYDRLDLSVLTGHLELWDVHVRPLDATEATKDASSQAADAAALSQLEFLNVDLDVSALFGGELRAHRVEIDGLDVYARRASVADGWEWEGLPAFQPKETDSATEKEQETDTDEPGPFAFDLPFTVDAIRLQHLQLHVHDSAPSPAFEGKLELNVRISDLGVDEQAARIEVFAHSHQFLDSLSVNAAVSLQGPEANINAEFALHGLRGGPIATYLAPLGLQPIAEAVDIEGRANLNTRSAQEEDLAISIDASLNDLRWSADGESQARLDAVTVRVPHFSGHAIATSEVLVQGGLVHAARNRDGHLEFGGFALVPVASQGSTPVTVGGEEPSAESPSTEGSLGTAAAEPPSGEASTASQSAEPAEVATSAAAPESQTTESDPPLELRIPSLRVEDIALAWSDQATAPAAQVDVQLERARLGPIQRVAGQTPPPIELDVTMSLPRTIETVQVVGALQAFADEQTVDLQLSADGVTLRALKPYLDAAGMQSQWQGGSWNARIQAKTRVDAAGVRHAEAQLSDLRLQSGADGLSLDTVSVEGVRLDPAQSLTHIDAVRITGMRGAAIRDEAQVWNTLGFAFEGPQGTTKATAPAPSSDAAPAPAPNEAKPAAGPVPRFELDRLVWENTYFELRDESLASMPTQVFDGLNLRAEDITLGRPANGEPDPPAQFELSLRAEELAERLALTGTLENLADEQSPLYLTWSARVTGTGLQLTPLEPWLTEFGVESDWDQATLRGDLQGFVQQQGDTLRARAEARDLAFENQGVAWLALEALEVPEVVVAPGSIVLEPISITAPRLRVERDAQGQLAVLALTLLPHPPATPTTLAADPVAVETAPSAPATDPAATTRIELPSLTLSGATVQWIDAAVSPTVDVELQVEAGLTDWVLGKPMQQPGRFEATLRVPGALDALSLRGEALLAGEELSAQVALRGEGMRAGPLASYLPPGVEVKWQEGEFAWDLSAAMGSSEEGGQKLSVLGENLRLGEKGASVPDLAWDRLALSVPRYDWDGGAVELKELAVQGLRLGVTRAVDGSLSALGVRFDPNAATPAQPQATEQPAATSTAAPDKTVPIAATSGSRRLPKLNPEDPPWIRLGNLDVGIEQLRFLDENGGEPMDLSLRLHGDGPLVLLSPEPESLDPIELRVSGAASPFVGSIDSRLVLVPYTPDPELDVAFALEGIDGPAITRVLPDLQERLDASAWQDGRVTLHSNAQLRLRRRGPLDFPLQDGFGLELEVDGFALEPNPTIQGVATNQGETGSEADTGSDLAAGPSDNPVKPSDTIGTLGFDSLAVQVASVRPKTGDVHIKLIDWVGPRLTAFQDERGLHVAGFVWKPAPADAAEVGSADAAQDEALASADGPASESQGAASSPSDPSGESTSAAGTGDSGIADADDPQTPGATPSVDSTTAAPSPTAGDTSNGSSQAASDPQNPSQDADASAALADSSEDAQTGGESPNNNPSADDSAPVVASTNPGATPAQDGTDAPLPTAANTPPAPQAELRIDEIFVAGEALRFEDRTVEPAMVLPISGWDLEAKRFSTLALQGERAFRFRLSLYGGELSLPERASGNLVGGLLGSVATLATGGKDEFDMEARPLFDEFLVRGNLALGAAPKGWVQARVRALELPAFRGAAAAAGVEIGDGLMDESAMVHMDGQGGLRVSSTTRFSYLSLSEPAGGPISTYLKLPAPLDSVLFALKDEDGDQTIPLNVAISSGGASMGTILGAVSKALGTLIGEALASSPMRVLGGVTDLVGLGGEPIELTGDEWVRLDYAPGEMQVPAQALAQVEPLLALLRRDSTLYLEVQQIMGQADIAQATQLANPSAERCLELAALYRQRRSALTQERAQVAAAVRLAYATGELNEANARTAELRQVDRQLATTEVALDRVLERTTDRGARAQARRTKSAALEVTRERQTLIGNLLRFQPVPSMATRLDLRRPRFGAPEDLEQGFVQVSVKRRR